MWGKNRGKEMAWAALSFLQVGILGEVSGEGFTEYSSVFQVCPYRILVATDWSVTGQGVFSHCTWFWLHPPGFAAFLGLDLNYNRGLDDISREERPEEKRLPWG